MANGMKKYEGQLLAMRGGAVEAQRGAREQKLEEGAAGGVSPIAKLRALNAERREDRRSVTPCSPGWSARRRCSARRRRSGGCPKSGPRPTSSARTATATATSAAIGRGSPAPNARSSPESDRATLRYALQQALALPADQRVVALDKALAATGKSADAAPHRGTAGQSLCRHTDGRSRGAQGGRRADLRRARAARRHDARPGACAGAARRGAPRG